MQICLEKRKDPIVRIFTITNNYSNNKYSDQLSEATERGKECRFGKTAACPWPVSPLGRRRCR